MESFEKLKNLYFQNLTFEEIAKLDELVSLDNFALLIKYLEDKFVKACIVSNRMDYTDLTKPALNMSRNKGIDDCIQKIKGIKKKINKLYTAEKEEKEKKD